VKPLVVISKLNPSDLPPPKDFLPPKDLTDEMKDAEDDTVVMPTRSVNCIASTSGGN